MQILFPSSFCALSCLSPFTVHAQSNRSLNHMFIHWDAESETRDEQVDLALNIATFAYEREVHRVQVQITREYECSLSSVSSHHSSMRHLISLLFLFCRWFIFLCLTHRFKCFHEHTCHTHSLCMALCEKEHIGSY